jgi:threonine dehydrogenase-like Zn-dependent dehydrogenase
VDRAIDAVGVDSSRPHSGPAAGEAQQRAQQFQQEVQQIAPEVRPSNGNWRPGDAPSLALEWAVQGVAKAGTLAVMGVYPQTDRFFPIGMAMNRNLTINMGNCNHCKYLPRLVDLVRNGTIKPREIITKQQPLQSAIDAYKAFDTHQEGWIKVELQPVWRPIQPTTPTSWAVSCPEPRFALCCNAAPGFASGARTSGKTCAK